MKKQYLPIVVRRDGSSVCAKLFSSHSKSFGDKFCWTLEEAEDIIQEVTTKLNAKTPHITVSGGVGIISEHLEAHEVVDSYIKVREVTEWEVIKGV